MQDGTDACSGNLIGPQVYGQRALELTNRSIAARVGRTLSSDLTGKPTASWRRAMKKTTVPKSNSSMGQEGITMCGQINCVPGAFVRGPSFKDVCRKNMTATLTCWENPLAAHVLVISCLRTTSRRGQTQFPLRREALWEGAARRSFTA